MWGNFIKVFINHISVNIYAFLLQNSHSYPRLSEGVWNILDKPIHALLESFWILKHIWPHEFWVRDLRRIIDIYWLSKRKSIRMVWESFQNSVLWVHEVRASLRLPFGLVVCTCTYVFLWPVLVLRLCQHLNIDLRTSQSYSCAL